MDSQYVLDAEILYTGRGPLSDKQQPGWLMRVMDNVWPF
ncbi:MAG: flagellar basal body L-ring protein FlgH [Desulfovermiculus sp.]